MFYAVYVVDAVVWGKDNRAVGDLVSTTSREPDASNLSGKGLAYKSYTERPPFRWSPATLDFDIPIPVPEEVGWNETDEAQAANLISKDSSEWTTNSERSALRLILKKLA